jgi:type I restriction enzyme M protein
MAKGSKVVYKLIKPDWVHEAEAKGYITIKENRIYYNACGKSYNFKDPEEKVRAQAYVELIERYKYPDKRIEPEKYPPRRIPKLPADLVVYHKEKNKCFIVVETKASERKFQEA